MRTFTLPFGLLLVLLATACREPAAPAVQPATAEDYQRSAFRDLNSLLVRLDESVAQVKDSELKRQAQAASLALQERREALRTNFSIAAYEELRLDILIDLRRTAAWVAEQLEQTRSPPAAPKA